MEILVSETALNVSTWIMLTSAIFTFILTMIIKAPYGRYSTEAKGWGPLIEARLAWVLMECPNLIIVGGFFWYASFKDIEISTANRLLIGLFCLHYTQRSIIYPAKMQPGQGSPMPLSVMLLGNFNSWLQDPRCLLGTCMFLIGFFGNMNADATLLALRSTCKKGEYKIPFGGLFNYVSAANYAWEIFEWTGFAVATWSLPGLAFAVYTFSNLGPRGYKHHQWYQQKFEDYPKHRKAVVPFVW